MLRRLNAFMLAVAVRTLTDERFNGWHIRRIPDDWQHVAPEIACKTYTVHSAAFHNFQHNHCCPHDVSCLKKLRLHSVADSKPLTIVLPLEDLHAIYGILLRVERPFARKHRIRQVLTKVFFVLLLNVATVLEHHISEILRCISTVPLPSVSPLVKQWYPAHVVCVCMGKDHSIYLRRLERKLRVLCDSLFAMPLEKPAVQKNALPVRKLNFMARACHLSCRTMGNNLHESSGN